MIHKGDSIGNFNPMLRLLEAARFSPDSGTETRPCFIAETMCQLFGCCNADLTGPKFCWIRIRLCISHLYELYRDTRMRDLDSRNLFG